MVCHGGTGCGWEGNAVLTRSSHAAAPADAAPTFSKAGFAYDAIRRKIIDGIYQPGDRLRLSELARELNLSEMPVREAMRLLQKDGLVVVHLHRGAQVARLSFQRGRDVTEARMTLERAAAVAAMPRHDADSLANLHRLLAEMERAASRPVRFAVKNRAFCTALFAPCPNGFIRQQIDDFWDQVWQASSTSVFEVMGHRVQETIDENRTILGHLQDRDARRLTAALDRRMRNTMAAWDGAVAREEQGRPPAKAVPIPAAGAKLAVPPPRRAAAIPRRVKPATRPTGRVEA